MALTKHLPPTWAEENVVKVEQRETSLLAATEGRLAPTVPRDASAWVHSSNEQAKSSIAAAQRGNSRAEQESRLGWGR